MKSILGKPDQTRSERLSVLEEEHRQLSARRRQLHEVIDMLDGVTPLRADAAARLEKYKLNEVRVSWQRQDLFRQIRELRDDRATQGWPA